MYYVPDYKIEPPETEAKVVCRCCECKKNLYEGEDAYRIGDKFFCEDCVEHTTLECDDPDWDSMPGGYDY